jgi:trimethyllysine dioxygenase
MFAARALLLTNPPNVTRCAALQIASSQVCVTALLHVGHMLIDHQHSVRLNSSSATGTTAEHGTKEVETRSDESIAKKVGERSNGGKKGLYAVIGPDHLAKAETLAFDMRALNYDLNRIYHRQRVMSRTLKGPYRVRTSVSHIPNNIKVKVTDGKVTVADRTIPNIWLRDNCQCGSCMHGATKQRLLDTFSIPKHIAIRSHEFVGDKSEDQVLNIEWSDGHQSSYPRTLLSQTAKDHEARATPRQGLVPVSLWDSSISSSPPKMLYHLVKNRSPTRMLRHLRKYGFCYVDDTPFEDPDDTKKLLEKIAFIRETHYGGFYDFTSDLASKDTAYTNIALEAHTDTTYFSDPVGLQAFHLLSHTEGEGGASLLVDGFKVADELSQLDRKAYEVLSTVNVHAHASGNEGISIQPYKGFPVLEHDSATGDLLRVRWNSSDRASIELRIDEVEIWYDAARKFDALLKKKENEYWEQLVPGRVLIFDNWRVLHGRSSFTGKRRICGAYVNRDDWISKFKMADIGSEEVLKGLAVH